jgi:prophage antirepressor-like protein
MEGKNEIMVLAEQEVLGKDFRVYGSLETPLFLAKDVAEWIEYAYKDSRQIHRDVSKMLSTVDDDEKAKYQLNLGGEDYSHGGVRGNVDTWFLTENGLYEVLMQSRKPIAKQFKKQVKVILKNIRTTGGHVGNADLFITTYLPHANEQTKMLFKATLQALDNLNNKLEEQRPLVEFAETVAASADTIDTGELAKLVHNENIPVGRNRLFK